jgi:hypothetical protein
MHGGRSKKEAINMEELHDLEISRVKNMIFSIIIK